MTAETIYQITVKFWKGNEDAISFSELKDRVMKNFEKARFISQGSSEAKIVTVKIIKEK